MALVSVLMAPVALWIYRYGKTDRAAPADVIIILGGGLDPDNRPSAFARGRIDHAVALYRKGLAPAFICTGGYRRDDSPTEAEACVLYLEQSGMPASAISVDNRSLSTEENANESKKIMQAQGYKTAILVTDDFHMLRAEKYFTQYGIPVFSSPAQATIGESPFWRDLGASYREVFALGWYELKTALGWKFTSTPM